MEKQETIFDNVKPEKRVWSDFKTAKDGGEAFGDGALLFLKSLGKLAKGVVLLLGFAGAVAFDGLRTAVRKHKEKKKSEVKPWQKKSSRSAS